MRHGALLFSLSEGMAILTSITENINHYYGCRLDSHPPKQHLRNTGRDNQSCKTGHIALAIAICIHLLAQS